MHLAAEGLIAETPRMKKFDDYENDILEAYEKGELVSEKPSKAEKDKFKSAAEATFVKDRRLNIRLSSPDLMEIQARALEEGVPYQTLIASIIHKFVSGRLVEKPSQLVKRAGRNRKQSAI
jgi:predicted DNA binding CopG/RHH family protein